MPPKKNTSPKETIAALRKRSRDLEEQLNKVRERNAKLKERVNKLKQRSRELKEKLKQPQRSVSFDGESELEELVNDIYRRLWSEKDLPDWVDIRSFRKDMQERIVAVLRDYVDGNEALTPMAFESLMLPLISEMIPDVSDSVMERLYNTKAWKIELPLQVRLFLRD